MPAMTPLDRTLVTFKEAVNWIAHDTFGDLSAGLQERHLHQESPPPYINEDQPEFPNEAAAFKSLLGALQEGDICALGRLSTTSNYPEIGWKFHSSHPTVIPPDFWLSGYFNYCANKLSNETGEYIKIVLQKFSVLNLWPPTPPITPPSPPSLTLQDMADYTPYLALVKQAVAHYWKNGMPPQKEKKEEIVNWLLEQNIEGLPQDKLSQNICEAIATMIRPLEAQKGGLQKTTPQA